MYLVLFLCKVEEIVDLEKYKNDIFTATALASEKESGLTELQKKNLRKVITYNEICTVNSQVMISDSLVDAVVWIYCTHY